MLMSYFEFLILDKWIERNRPLCGSVGVHALMENHPRFGEWFWYLLSCQIVIGLE